MNTADRRILEEPIWKALVVFFIPCWMGMLFQQLYSTVDTWIVGNFVSTNAVAAVGNVATAVSLVLGVCVSIGSGSGVVISQHYGAGKTAQLKEDVRASLMIAVVGGLVLTAACVALAEDMVAWLETPVEIAEDSATYLGIYFLALVPNLIYNFGAAILRGMGDSKTPLYILILTSVINIALDLVFVVAFRMGVFGVALATDISMVVSAAVILAVMMRRMPGLLKRDVQAQSVYGDIFRIGLPSAFQSIMYSSSNVLIQVAINGFGTTVIAAWSIYGKVDCISWMTMSSMGMAVTAFAGQNFGAGNYDRVKKCAWVSGWLLGAVMVVLVIIFCLLAEPIFRVFTKDADVVAEGTAMLLFLTPAYMLYFLIELLPGIVRGCGDVVIPTIASMIGVCLIRVLWLRYVVPVYHTMDMVMMSYVITWGITSLFYVIYFARGKWLERCIARSGMSERI